jgi:hypothetical protein
MASAHTTMVCPTVADSASRTACPTVPWMAMMNAAIIDFA